MRHLALLPLLLVVSACLGPSSLETAYNNADWLIGKEIERRFCPATERRAAWETQIDALLRWHRARELPRYAALLRRLAPALAEGLTRARFDAARREVDAAVQRLLRRSAGPVAQLLARTENRELECLEGAVASALTQGLEASDAPELPREVVRGVLGRVEAFAGSFTEAQEQALMTRWAPTREKARAEAQRRHRGSQAFLNLLRAGDPASREKALTRILRGDDSVYAGADLAEGERLRELAVERVWDVLQVLSPEQRQTLADSALRIAEAFERLAARREAAR